MCKVHVLKLQAKKCSAVTEFFYFSGGVDEIFICIEKGEVRILSNGGKTFSSNCILISKGICSLSNSDHKFQRK